MNPQLSNGAIERIMSGDQVEKPILQVLGQKKIAGNSGAGADRYRLLLSDGRFSHSSAMLATQLNHLVSAGQLDQFTIIQLEKYLCNQIQPDRRVVILLDVTVLKLGKNVSQRLGNPTPYKPGVSGQQNNENPQQEQKPVVEKQPVTPQNKGFYGNKPLQSRNTGGVGTGAPNTPGGTPARVYPIASLTPYQNKWTVKARVTMKSAIRTWQNARGEGKLFSMNLLDESGEIKATAFKEECDKYYDLIEVNKVYYFTRGTLKTANKQYSSLNNEYEMTFNSDTQVTRCEEEGSMPTIKFNFVKINTLAEKEPNSTVDVIGVVKSAGDINTVVGKTSNKEITKRDLFLVDQSGVQVRMTLWGNDAQTFQADANPVIAVKGCKLSDWGGRSLSVLSSSQVLVMPEIDECFALQGWYDSEGSKMDFSEYKSDGATSGGGSGTNWKTFTEAKLLGGGEKGDYFTAKATVVFLKKENSMYMACPSAECNKKVIDQGNGMYRCEKCQQDFPNYKWRMILSANLADYTNHQWITCFQESAEQVLSVDAAKLGELKDTNFDEYERIFNEATFKSYIFKLRAKIETYNDDQRLKTICVDAKPVNYVDYSKKLAEDIEKMMS